MLDPNKPILMLLRGLPGSGKTALADLLTASLSSYRGESHLDPVYFEADSYFYDDEGNYNFEPERLGEAHNQCQTDTYQALEEGTPLVIVSNTTTAEWELETYQAIAAAHKATFISLIVENRHGGISKHGVPEHTLLAMQNRFSVKL
tara:strand:+ start:167 stop:607 length:441 start_codon:yes stop_codon:yes gene_type:complete